VGSKQFRLPEDGLLHLVDEVVAEEPHHGESYAEEQPTVGLLPVVRDLGAPVAEPEPEEHGGVGEEHEYALVDSLLAEPPV